MDCCFPPRQSPGCRNFCGMQLLYFNVLLGSAIGSENNNDGLMGLFFILFLHHHIMFFLKINNH
jgi:hypothetical protein